MGKKHLKKKMSSTTPSALVEPVPFLPPSPFRSEIIEIKVGQSQELFNLHRNVLPQADVLLSKLDRDPSPQTAYIYCGFHCHPNNKKTLVIPDITPSLFDFVLRYLYGTSFENLNPILNSLVEPNGPYESLIEPACELYCFTLKYGLPELQDEIITYIESQAETGYHSVLTAAKHVYNHAPRIEDWFREFFCNKTRATLVNSEIADEAWFLDTFEDGHNGLSKDVFQCYRDVSRVLRRGVDTVLSETNRAVDGEPISCEPLDRDYHNTEEQTQEVASGCGPVAPDIETEETSAAPASPSGSPSKNYELEEHPIEEAVAPEAYSPIEVTLEEIPCEEEPELVAEAVTDEMDLPWDFGLRHKARRKKRKQMEADGIIFSLLGEPIYPEPEPEPEPELAQPFETIEEPILHEHSRVCRSCGVKQV